MDQILDPKLIRSVSRSFSLSLLALPKTHRTEVALTYLLARFADTLTDSGQWTLEDRLAHLTAWENAILQKNCSLWKLKGTLGSFDQNEVNLLLIGDALLKAFVDLPKSAQINAEEVLKTLISAMKWDLKTFGAATKTQPVAACKDAATFDWYCFSIAGCVGRYWVKVFGLPLNLENLAVEYGKGLQRINILRDHAEDLQKGRIYFPQDSYASMGWNDFVANYIVETKRLLRYGANFCDSIPYFRWKLKWASMMPLRIGLETLKKLEAEMFRKPSPVKISRSRVKSLVWKTALDVLLNRKLSDRVDLRG